MANVKTTLTVAGNGTSNTFSNTKNYTEETVTKFYVDNTEIFTDLIVFSPDDESPAKTATSTGAPKSFCIYNSGTTGVEIQIQNSSWATDTDPHTLTGAVYFNSFLLGAGDFFFSNQLRLIQTGADNGGGSGGNTSLALASSKVSAALTTIQARGGQVGVISGADGDGATAIVIADGALRFREGDYLFVNSGDGDVIRVVSVESDTEFTVERGNLGYTPQVLDDGSLVYMFAGSHLHDKNTEDDSGVNIRTDAMGRFKGMLLGDSGVEPRGTAQTLVASGIDAGSVAIQFPINGGYQNLGVSVGSADSTGLALGQAYTFKITDSLGTTADITFTTDSSDVTWGKVIELINQAFIDASLDYTCGIINSDVRFSAKKWLGGESITLVDGTGTTPWNVGNVPDTDDHETPVKTRFPRTTITDVQSGKKVKNTQNMLIDDGTGRLIGAVGSGTIDYDSGVVDFVGPYRAEFKTSFNYGAAHAGIPTRAANLSNMVKLIAARSCNSLKNGEVTLICYS